jgi:hypothetical protein
MSSDVEICNMALGLVGVAQEISSIDPPDDNSTEAQQCVRFYTATRDALLREYPWPFATKYATLGLVASNPNSDWGFAYRYPSSCIRAHRLVIGQRISTTRVPWELAHDDTGRLIYTDLANAVLKFTELVTNTALFDPLFVEALAGKLGMRLAVPLSRSDKDYQRAAQFYKDAINTAWPTAAKEGAGDAPNDAENIQARG